MPEYNLGLSSLWTQVPGRTVHVVDMPSFRWTIGVLVWAFQPMKRILFSFFALAGLGIASLWAASTEKPKLILAVVLDQFRYDYLTRFRGEYHGGLERLLTKGAVFTNARYEHFPTVTAIGHSTFLTGATPALSGIVGNEWYEREEGRKVTSVSDSKTKLLGGTGEGSSPRRLLVETIGDELKIADGGKSRVIGISLKDRSAILPVGHMANGAFWFDTKSGNFVSSTYYFADLPGWVKDFNGGKPADKNIRIVVVSCQVSVRIIRRTTNTGSLVGWDLGTITNKKDESKSAGIIVTCDIIFNSCRCGPD